MLRLCLLCLLSTILLSCLSEPDCIITASNEVKIALSHAGYDDSVRFAKFDRIEVSGTDSVFHVGDSVSSVVLPVDPGSLQTTFRFYYEIVEDTVTFSKEDSVKVIYTRVTRVISPDCGAFNYFQDLAIVLSTFAEATVNNSQLSTSDSKNITVKL